MNKRLFALCIAMITIWGSAHAEEFYFGAQGNQNITYTNMTISELRSMRDTLGFNVYSALSAWPSMLDMMDDYLKLIPDMYIARGDTGAMLEAFADYSAAHYAKVEAEDDDMYQIRFRGPRVVENGFAMAPYDPDTSYEEVYLDSLWYKHRDSRYTYGIKVRAVDGGTAAGDTMAYGDTIGFIKIWTGNWYGDLQHTLIETYYIEADTFLNAGSDTLYLEFGPIDRKGLDYIQIGTNNACSLGVDFLKIYNEKGWNLVEDGQYITQIDSFAQANSQYVLNWHLRDEPQFLEWKPFKMIANALENCASCSTATSTFNVSVGQSPKDFITKADPAFLWPDSYPLWGGQYVEKTIYYSGDSTKVETFVNRNMVYYAGTKTCPSWWSTPCDRSLQYNLDKVYIREMDSLYSASVSLGKDLWLFPQGFAGRHITHTDYPADPTIDSIYYDADDGWYWRPPTESELSCVTFMGMCYPLKGLTYWRYDSYGNNPNGLSSYHMRGIIDTGLVRTELWYAIKNNIGPYINAIGDLFVTLDYDTSYPVHHGTPSFDPPPGAWLDSIRAVSNSPDSNPDLGWFHVGQFTEGSDKYVMIVNRACSQGPNNPAPAPSVTATIKFNVDNLHIAEYVYIIDIAAGTDSSDWDGTSDTTYSAVMPDGTIPFTTVLGPGEGRLFKITEAPFIELKEELNSNLIYQGAIPIVGDLLVLPGDTMKIVGPAILAIQGDVSIVLEAASVVLEAAHLEARGTLLDTIFFTISGGEEYRWASIILDEEASADMEYVSIDHAKYGLELIADNNVVISNSRIGECGDAIQAHKRVSLTIDNSTISNSANAAVTCIYPVELNIDQTNFTDNRLYAISVVNGEGAPSFTNININGRHNYGIKFAGNSPDVEIPYFDEVHISSSNPFETTGLEISTYTGGDVVMPLIKNSSISGYENGIHLLYTQEPTFIGPNVVCEENVVGILLFESWVEINGEVEEEPISNKMLNNEYAGLLGYVPFGKVRSSEFINNVVGAEHVGYSELDFGRDETGEWGNNIFEDNAEFHMLNSYNDFPEILAYNNWWGSDDPDDFEYLISGYVLWDPFLTERPELYKISPDALVPLRLELSQSYPNPFNAVTKIDFAVPKNEFVTITIYNILGQKVNRIYNQETPPGTYSVIWNGKDASDKTVSSGIYLYSLQTSEKRITKKMALLK